MKEIKRYYRLIITCIALFDYIFAHTAAILDAIICSDVFYANYCILIIPYSRSLPSAGKLSLAENAKWRAHYIFLLT